MFKYGPLRYIIDLEEDEEGNYYWPGLPPVGYDDIGIPIDENGNQCLPGETILHLNYVPTETEWCDLLQVELPTLDSVRPWFEDNFLVVTNKDLCRYIFKWYWWNYHNSDSYKALIESKSFSSVQEIMEAVWPDVMTS